MRVCGGRIWAFVCDERVSCTYCLGRAARGTWLSPCASGASPGDPVGCADSSSAEQCHSPPLALKCRVPSGDGCCRHQTPKRRAPPRLLLESAGHQRALEGQVGWRGIVDGWRRMSNFYCYCTAYGIIIIVAIDIAVSHDQYKLERSTTTTTTTTPNCTPCIHHTTAQQYKTNRYSTNPHPPFSSNPLGKKFDILANFLARCRQVKISSSMVHGCQLRHDVGRTEVDFVY